MVVDGDEPLTDGEKQFLLDAGWVFLTDSYIYIPDDYDGCMASGIKNIRRIINGIERAKAFQAAEEERKNNAD